MKNTRGANKKPVSFETRTNGLNLNISLPNILNKMGIFSEDIRKKDFLPESISI